MIVCYMDARFDSDWATGFTVETFEVSELLTYDATCNESYWMVPGTFNDDGISTIEW